MLVKLTGPVHVLFNIISTQILLLQDHVVKSGQQVTCKEFSAFTPRMLQVVKECSQVD